MKKNGFTLIELIVTIALLGLVGIVISFSMVNLLDNQKDERKSEFKSIMEEAACTYVLLSYASWNGAYVEGDKLIQEGLVEEEINGYKVSNYKVNVSNIDGERKCTLEGEV